VDGSNTIPGNQRLQVACARLATHHSWLKWPKTGVIRSSSHPQLADRLKASCVDKLLLCLLPILQEHFRDARSQGIALTGAQSLVSLLHLLRARQFFVDALGTILFRPSLRVYVPEPKAPRSVSRGSWRHSGLWLGSWPVRVLETSVDTKWGRGCYRIFELPVRLMSSPATTGPPYHRHLKQFQHLLRLRTSLNRHLKAVPPLASHGPTFFLRPGEMHISCMFVTVSRYEAAPDRWRQETVAASPHARYKQKAVIVQRTSYN